MFDRVCVSVSAKLLSAFARFGISIQIHPGEFLVLKYKHFHAEVRNTLYDGLIQFHHKNRLSREGVLIKYGSS